MSGNICEQCSAWINCGEKDKKPYGFCLWEDLYTYTERSWCKEFSEGRPMDIKEYESYG